MRPWVVVLITVILVVVAIVIALLVIMPTGKTAQNNQQQQGGGGGTTNPPGGGTTNPPVGAAVTPGSRITLTNAVRSQFLALCDADLGRGYRITLSPTAQSWTIRRAAGGTTALVSGDLVTLDSNGGGALADMGTESDCAGSDITFEVRANIRAPPAGTVWRLTKVGSAGGVPLVVGDAVTLQGVASARYLSFCTGSSYCGGTLVVTSATTPVMQWTIGT